ncbi:DUF1585 domain-containing protein [Nannocystis pusilla]|uniref:DUF1585 domain-containing protein n=1 Tax=Nannocystis pusilla TaxID=889268 RepID=A0ABS7TXK5_9BACT|nr:DUF1585 domain-containing protein [Nannocystis pusilla]MBZ5712886.1 DUF1585 domain-containing protein [Nannocystis pusilla]
MPTERPPHLTPTVFLVRSLSRHTRCLLAFAGISVGTTEAWARPTGPRAFCETYADAPECMGRSVTCNKCHLSTQPVAWNAYGGAVFAALGGGAFDDNIAAALVSIEDDDSDGDGLSNREEIELGTDPGDPLSQWMPRPTPEGAENPSYAIGEYDPSYAYKRVRLLFCGASPSYKEARAFAELDGEAQLAAIHDALAECLESDFWIDEALTSLAHPKIRPVKALGAETDVLISGYKITLADYQWDYRLWQYLLSGDRDARELLTAQYHIGRDDAGNWQRIDGTIPNPPMGFGGGQLLAPEHRAGMLTTQWNLLLNIMFAAVPRVAAGHAYREYLGLDLSLSQGIRPVAGEPLDIDAKGVDAAACAQCHSTLDPLSYAFAYYEGIDLKNLSRTGQYRPERPTERIPGWDEAQPEFVVLDRKVENLVELAQQMAQSREFQRNLADMFFVYAVGHEPLPDELEEFDAVWTAMPADGYSANRLLHRLVDTDAFGVP